MTSKRPSSAPLDVVFEGFTLVDNDEFSDDTSTLVGCISIFLNHHLQAQSSASGSNDGRPPPLTAAACR